MPLPARLRPLLLGAVLALGLAGPATAESPFELRLAQAGRELDGELSDGERAMTAEFVFGTALFALFHELGHALASEFRLAPPHREEAFDGFAVLALSSLGDELSDGVLTAAADAWFLDEEADGPIAFYRAHHFDRPRALRVACLLAGSDPADRSLAREVAGLSARRCAGDYRHVEQLWDELLRSHLRDPAGPSPRIDLIYDAAKPGQGPYRDALRALRLLETVGAVADRYALPHRITIEARSCGAANARWDPEHKRLTFCYELAAAEAANLLRDQRQR